MAKLLSWIFSVQTLEKALSNKTDIMHTSIMTSTDIYALHRRIQREIDSLGLEDKSFVSPYLGEPRHLHTDICLIQRRPVEKDAVH